MKLNTILSLVDVELLCQKEINQDSRSVKVVIVRLLESMITPCGTINYLTGSILAVLNVKVCYDDVIRGSNNSFSAIEVSAEFYEGLGSDECLRWLSDQFNPRFIPSWT